MLWLPSRCAWLYLARASVAIVFALVVHQAGIPGGRHADGLREHRGITGARHAVQRLAPPVVGRNAEPGDGRRGVLHLPDLLFQRHARDQIVHPLLDGQRRIAIRG